ncbi:MAG: PfkB family carbohydrate kinase [Parvularculaceae bacterium]
MARIMCIGHAVLDYVFSLPDLPSGGRKHRASAFDCVGGGPAATAAVAIARLGGKAARGARRGADWVADAIISELEDYGVDCARVRRFAGRASSLSAVMVDARGERMIVNYRDEKMPADARWIGDASGFDAVLADTRWPEGAAAGFSAARTAKIPAVLDADDPVPDDPAMLGRATHLAFSADGLEGLTGEKDPARGLKSVRARFGAWACVTDGARGVLLCDDDGVSAIGAFDVDPVDTLGAGDVWHGAFALALGDGAAETDAVRFANAAAAIKVTRAGGRKGAPARAEVEAFLTANMEMEPRF